MDIHNYQFPQNQKVFTLAIALAANGASSYRDACNVCRMANEKWDSSNIILCDSLKHIKNVPNTTQVILVRNKQELLQLIINSVKYLKNCDLLFSLSAHGYGTTISPNLKNEMNDQSEFVKVSGQQVMDFELAEALYSEMSHDVNSLCLIDTCHSGTMLDLEYISTDGNVFHRSRIPNRKRPFSVCISACNDFESTGEDISKYGGWGGKLISFFLDHFDGHHHIHILSFYKQLRQIFSNQTSQKSHPLISYNQ